MIGAHHDDIALVQEHLPLDIGERRDVADGEIDPAAFHRGQDVRIVELERLEAHALRELRDPGHQSRQEDRFPDVAHVQAKRALRAQRVVGVLLAQRSLERAQGLLDRCREPLTLRRHRHAALRAHEQRIVQRKSQPRERMADRRLRDTEPLGGARHVARRVHGGEGAEQVEIELREVGRSDGIRHSLPL